MSFLGGPRFSSFQIDFFTALNRTALKQERQGQVICIDQADFQPVHVRRIRRSKIRRINELKIDSVMN